MKKFNQFMSVILVITLIIPTCLNASFAVSIDNQSLIYREIEKSLSAIIPEKEYYGLGDVDMGNLSIGEKIPTYEVVDRNLEPTSVSLYPIFDNTGALVVVAATSTINGEIIVSISQTFVDTLRLLAPNSQISIIYDKNDAYLLNDGTLTKLTEYPYENHLNRDDIETLTENSLASLHGTALSANKRLSVADLPTPLGMDNEEIYLSVPKKTQPSGSLICWAACCASILEYISGRNYDPEQIAELYGSIDGELPKDVLAFMNKSFTVDYKQSYTNDYINIWLSLWADKPVYGGFQNLSKPKNAHALVIRGISYWSVFSVMDPDTGIYATGTINGSGTWTSFNYLMARTGDKYSLWAYLYGSK